jgi:hypothetical protein
VGGWLPSLDDGQHNENGKDTISQL